MIGKDFCQQYFFAEYLLFLRFKVVHIQYVQDSEEETFYNIRTVGASREQMEVALSVSKVTRNVIEKSHSCINPSKKEHKSKKVIFEAYSNNKTIHDEMKLQRPQNCFCRSWRRSRNSDGEGGGYPGSSRVPRVAAGRGSYHCDVYRGS